MDIIIIIILNNTVSGSVKQLNAMIAFFLENCDMVTDICIFII